MSLPSRPALVVFDLAGTTIQDRGEVPDAFRRALREHGLEATAEEIDRVRGSSKRQAIRRFIPAGPLHDERAEEIYLSFREHLARRYASGGVHPVPGAEATFAALRALDIRIALNTGFDRDTTELLLGELGWNEGVADTVVCGDDVALGRPAPDMILRAIERTGTPGPGFTANVGDTVLDLRAGDEAKVRWNVAVLTGAHERRVLESAPHTHIVPSVAELAAVWE